MSAICVIHGEGQAVSKGVVNVRLHQPKSMWPSDSNSDKDENIKVDQTGLQ